MRLTWRRLACFLSLTCSLYFTLPGHTAVDTSWINNCKIVPQCLGISMQITSWDHPQMAKDFQNMHQMGFRIVRVAMLWDWVEWRKGSHDFSQFDIVNNNLRANGLRPMYILAMGNKQYPSVSTTLEGRKAFTSYAKDAAAHYKNDPVIWELWNEPNTSAFWPPSPNTTQYMDLAKMVVPAIRSVNPNAIVVGPGLLRKKPPTNAAVHMLETDFMMACFKQGFSSLFNAVSYHPYRMEAPTAEPETMTEDYKMMGTMVDRLTRPQLPLINSERSYSASQLGSDEKFGNYMVRSYLVALMNDVPYFIWYLWKGSDEAIVSDSGAEKPVAKQIRLLTTSLGGYQYDSRLTSGAKDYLLLFAKGKQYKVAAWTTGTSHGVTLYPGKNIQLSQSPAYYDIPVASIPKGRMQP